MASIADSGRTLAQADEQRTAESDRLDGQRVLVTGATGFIGGHVVEFLHRIGAEVHAVHRGPNPTTSFRTPVTWHHADLADPTQTLEAASAAEPDHVVHLASLVKGARDPELVIPMLNANLASAVHILEAARQVGARRVLLAGSLEEPDPTEAATSPYAVSKAAANLYGDYYRSNVGLEVVNLQIFMVYGPATRDQNKLVPYLVRSLLTDQAPELSSGSRMVDWVYVQDVAEGVARCLLTPEPPDAPVPLGTGQLSSIRQVVEHLLDLTGNKVEPKFGSAGDRDNEVVRAANVDETRRLLGWAPSTDLRDGLKSTLSWHQSQQAKTEIEVGS